MSWICDLGQVPLPPSVNLPIHNLAWLLRRLSGAMTVKFMSAASPGIVGAPPAVWDLHQGTSGAPTTGTCTPEAPGSRPCFVLEAGGLHT